MTFLALSGSNGSRKKIYMTAFLLATTMLATGCASTAKAETLETAVPRGSVMTVIRYPAVVETSAKEAYHKAFENSPIGGNVSSGGEASDRQSVADSVIVKSNYFALSLYKELAARLPEHSVLLSRPILILTRKR